MLKLLISFFLSRLTGRVVHRGKPFAVSVEPGTACALHCPECPTGAGLLKRPKGMAELSWFKRSLNEMSPEVTVLNLYLQGEPFLHPDICEMIKAAYDKDLYVITSTNGQHFTKTLAEAVVLSGLSEIYFSLDGVTQQIYEKYRRDGNIKKVKDAINLLDEAKKKHHKKNPFTVAQFIVFKHNEHEIGEFKKLAKKLGADKTEIKSAQFNDFKGSGVEPPVDPRSRRYADNHKLKGKSYNHCWKSWMSLVFTWEGVALPCCYDKDAENVLGDINEMSFAEIWNGKQNAGFRDQILKDKSKINICSNCPEGRSFFM